VRPVKILRTGTPTPLFMERTKAGPEGGDFIFVKGEGDCKVETSKVRIDANNKSITYKIRAITDSGDVVVGHFPAEELFHSGFSWSNTQVPFELSLEEHKGCFHIIDLESQDAYDIITHEFATPAMALAKLRMQQQDISPYVDVHSVYAFVLKPSAQRWMASIRRLILNGTHTEGPLRDCFTHPLSAVTALAPLKKINKTSQLVEMQMDMESVFKKHIPEGIKWPALSEGVRYDTMTMTPLKMEIGGNHE